MKKGLNAIDFGIIIKGKRYEPIFMYPRTTMWQESWDTRKETIMKKELDEQLCRECPNLYADREASMETTCMCWGFECMDGWFQIIYNLSLKLEALIVAMPEEERGNFRASQIKEKLGTLRYYMTSETDEMFRLICEAEDESEKTCEYCGEPGKLRTGGWLFTLCDSCNAERPWRKR